MTLRDYMNEHFFDSITPYEIQTEDGKKLDIEWNEFENYEFIECVKTEDLEIMVVNGGTNGS